MKAHATFVLYLLSYLVDNLKGRYVTEQVQLQQNTRINRVGRCYQPVKSRQKADKSTYYSRLPNGNQCAHNRRKNRYDDHAIAHFANKRVHELLMFLWIALSFCNHHRILSPRY